MRRRLRILSASQLLLFGAVLALFPGALLPSTAQAAQEAQSTHSTSETIWAGLIYATNEERPTRPPRSIAPVAKKLSRIFGYNQFTLLGEQKRPLDSVKDEAWLIAGKPFALSVQTKEARPHATRSGNSDNGGKRPLPAASRVAPGFGSMANSAPYLPPTPLMSYRLKLVLYQGDKYIVQTDVELDRSSPVFIRGPLFGKGQLILMLQVN